jgi:hypothetical protein
MIALDKYFAAQVLAVVGRFRQPLSEPLGHTEARDPERACGSCTLCCTVLAIDELQKPACAHCPHELPRTGCGIYAHRPPSCARFQCLWLATPTAASSLRPDRVGGLLALYEGELYLHEDAEYPGMAAGLLAGVIEAYTREEGRTVTIVSGPAEHRTMRVVGGPKRLPMVPAQESA